jgi:hypothetical protein
MSNPVNPDHFALVIGIDHYPVFRCLKGAVNDALEFYKWLLEDSGGGLVEANCRKLLSPDAPQCSPQDYEKCTWAEKHPCTWFPTGNKRKPIQDDIDDACRELLSLAKVSVEQTGRRAGRL